MLSDVIEIKRSISAIKKNTDKVTNDNLRILYFLFSVTMGLALLSTGAFL
jgi:hypothetical protein